MTKLRWDKADEYVADPGAVIEVPEPTRPSRWTGPSERRRKAVERAEKNRELRERSEQHDRDLFAAGMERKIRAMQERGEQIPALFRLFLKQQRG